MKLALKFTDDNLKKVPQDKPGAYLCGNIENGKFVVDYWGSSFSELGVRLSTHKDEYEYFKYVETKSDILAWHVECKCFHDYGTDDTDNKKHPKRPDGQDKDSLPCKCKNSQSKNCPL